MVEALPDAKSDTSGPRGRQSPSYSLGQAIGFLELLNSNSGEGPYGREIVARGLGHSSVNGASNVKIGAMTHFGLLEARRGGTYSTTDLSHRVLRPTSEEEKRQAIVEAAKKPDLYRELIQSFNGKQLPTMLENILVRQYGVIKYADEVASNFRDTITFAGLYRNGIVVDHERPEVQGIEKSAQLNTGSESKPVLAKETNGQPLAQVTDLDSALSNSSSQRYTIPLNGEGRIAELKIPLPVKSSDLETIRNWAAFMLHVVGKPVE